MMERILKWNTDRGLISKGFNHDLESAFIIEEVLESYGYDNAKDISREYVKALGKRSNIAINGVIATKTHNPTMHDILDAWVDIFIYNVGGLYKLTPFATDAIRTVMDKNDAKGSKTDSAGKIIKNDDFVEPDLSDLIEVQPC